MTKICPDKECIFFCLDAPIINKYKERFEYCPFCGKELDRVFSLTPEGNKALDELGYKTELRKS